MVQRLSHTTFFVLDQDRALEFYVHKLGFAVHTDHTMSNGFRWLTVTAPAEPKHEIALVLPGPPIVDEEARESILKLLHANAMGAGVLETDDCKTTYRELLAKGVEFTGEPVEEFYATEVTLRDGCGNWFSLSQPKPH